MVILDTQYTTAMGSIMEQQLHSAVWKYDNDFSHRKQSQVLTSLLYDSNEEYAIFILLDSLR